MEKELEQSEDLTKQFAEEYKRGYDEGHKEVEEVQKKSYFIGLVIGIINGYFFIVALQKLFDLITFN